MSDGEGDVMIDGEEASTSNSGPGAAATNAPPLPARPVSPVSRPPVAATQPAMSSLIIRYVLYMVLIVLVIFFLNKLFFEGFQYQGLRAGNAALILPTRKEGAEFGIRDRSFVFPPRHM